ncbi:archease [candidate division WOR-3 bacterium]|nr:archease [candidate division WOR-3 bacterium]
MARPGPASRGPSALPPDTGYRLLDHTADLLVQFDAPDLPRLFAVAAQAVFDVMVDLKQVRETETKTLELGPAEPPDLFLDWLREVLFLFSARGFCVARAEVRLEPAGGGPTAPARLSARLSGEPYDPGRHGLKLEIKTPTYHRYRLTTAGHGWQAVVLFDV